MSHAATLSVLITSVAALVHAQTLDPGTVIVADRVHGTLLYQPTDIVATNGIISGDSLGYPTGEIPTRGTGPTLANSAHLSLLAVPGANGYRLLARRSTNPAWGLYEVATNGDRSLLPGTSVPSWATGGDMLLTISQDVLSIADDFTAGVVGSGRIFRYSLATQSATLVTGNLVGSGVDMHRPRAMTMLDPDHVAVVEFGNGALLGTLVYMVDLNTGSRQVISTVSRVTPSRYSVASGVRSSGATQVPRRGTGPTFNSQSRGIIFTNNRLFVSGTVSTTTGTFLGGLLEIDMLTGNRTLFAGSALDDTGAVVTTPLGANSAPAGLDAPSTLIPMAGKAIVFVDPFLAPNVWRLDLQTKRLTSIANFSSQIAQPQAGTVALSSLTFTPCDGSPVTLAPLVPNSPMCPGGQILLTALPTPAGATYAYTWEIQNADSSWSRIDDGPIEDFATAANSTSRVLTLDSIDPLAQGRLVRVHIEGFCGNATSTPVAISVSPTADCPTCAPCPADFDANGGVDGSDLALFFQAYEGGATCADVDQNGGVDGNDLAVFFATYEAGGC